MQEIDFAFSGGNDRKPQTNNVIVVVEDLGQDASGLRVGYDAAQARRVSSNTAWQIPQAPSFGLTTSLTCFMSSLSRLMTSRS